jgi:multiple sugar transport system permease protein
LAVILKTEQRNLASRVIYLIMYVVLAIGGSTMVYPFMVMVSESFKSRVEANDGAIVPTYLRSDAALFRKQQESKYAEDLQLYLTTTGDTVRNFRAIEPPPAFKPQLVDDWKAFRAEVEMPTSWFVTGYGPTLDGRIIQRHERGFRDYLKAECDGDIAEFRRRYNEPVENWFYLKFRLERLADRKYQVGRTALMKSFYTYKAELPEADRIWMSVDGEYSRYGVLTGSVQGPRILGNVNRTGDWDAFVRTTLHPQFITVAESVRPRWTGFLAQKYQGDIANLNKLYQDEHSGFDYVPFPSDRITSSAELTDFMLFTSDENLAPGGALSVDTPEQRWRVFLTGRYKSAETAGAAHGRDYASWAAVGIPHRELDFAGLQADRGTLVKHYLWRNFQMVFDYVLIYGRGLWTTFIYCFWSIVLALLVNPLAAYALSRYKLPNQYKVLLFLICTMAFPGVVTMIPNFLLLRDLGMLNTFAALLLPAMANGYSIFLLKGFFDSLPRELYEAADIDGAGEWQKFWMITMNLSKPVLAVIALGAFTAAYANIMYAFILCQDQSMWTLMVWLYQLQQFSSQGVVFASLLVAAVPTLLIFVFCQNLIIKGIVVPTEK